MRYKWGTSRTSSPPAFALPLAALVLLAACGGGGGAPRAAPSTTAPLAPTTTTTEPPPPPPAPPATPPAPPAPPASGHAIPRPLLGTWVHLFDDSLKTPEGVATVVDAVADAGLDALFVQVVRRHDAYYASQVLPRTPDPALAPNFDVLAEVLARARPRGLQVHAWFTVGTALHHAYQDLELPPGHVYRDHGPGTADPWLSVAHDGRTSSEYFDVGLPELHQHAAGIAADIASRYAVDGIHLDYVRYDGPEWGYHPRALAAFHAATGRTDRPAPSDAQWSSWRRGRTQALVEGVRAAIDAVAPEVALSAAVIALGPGPQGTPGGFAGTRAAGMQQDWPAWVAGGVLDLVVPMAYQREADPNQGVWFREWAAFAGDLADRHAEVRIALGVGGWLNGVPAGMAHVEEAIRRTGGAVIFSYQQDSADQPRGALLRALAAR